MVVWNVDCGGARVRYSAVFLTTIIIPLPTSGNKRPQADDRRQRLVNGDRNEEFPGVGVRSYFLPWYSCRDFTLNVSPLWIARSPKDNALAPARVVK